MIKCIDAPGYHLRMNMKTGYMARWGKTLDDDPAWCPIGPELLDVEISTVCNGINGKPCAWCYKSNTGVGKNMTLETFRKILAKLPPTVTQIAFGIGDIHANPDLWAIMTACCPAGVVPNITVNGTSLDRGDARRLAEYCGAVAVSHYGDDDLCFGAVKKLSDAGLKQVNIHKLFAAETLQQCHDLIDKAATDERLAGLKAIVFLLLKPKGARNKLTPVRDLGEFKKLYDHAREKGIAIGMDSCSAPMALKTMDASVIPQIDCCESTLFSLYVDVDGRAHPCSFCAGTAGWEKGVDVVNAATFDTVWNDARIKAFRARLTESSAGCTGCSVQKHCRSCPVYDVTPCRGA